MFIPLFQSTNVIFHWILNLQIQLSLCPVTFINLRHINQTICMEVYENIFLTEHYVLMELVISCLNQRLF